MEAISAANKHMGRLHVKLCFCNIHPRFRRRALLDLDLHGCAPDQGSAEQSRQMHNGGVWSVCSMRQHWSEIGESSGS